ncbi:NTP transferase domain-containing protein [Paracidovorax wautersii]|uniref:Molybdenum cofactor cytidylyltransferase n=1 Tax=Paracidovorax wautersii TaxID=1177982 RepID=A0ABU1I5X9_9BURK|nr:NTP transferase domain-containing protein [Paracidovorax wautersii]MDR6212480.1 molybdenum cofactor cytidylyltransferase [Paracidovorax wautersii]
MDDRPEGQARFAASILAAGHGSRMGHVPKAAFRVQGQAILERQVASLRGAGVGEISVVIGPYRAQLEPLVAHCKARLVLNETGSTDVVTSQMAAIQDHYQVHAGHDMLVLLGDLPSLMSSHIQRLTSAWLALARDVHAAVPTHVGVRGHPILLSWEAVKAIAESDRPDEGIRGWLLKNRNRVQFLEMRDPAYVQDVDTEEDLLSVGGIP